MTIRHNAELTIIYGETDQLVLYLTSYADEDRLCKILRAALTRTKHLVKSDPERYAVNIFFQACKLHADPLLIAQHDRYTYSYQVNLTFSVPTVTINHNINELSKTIPLFDYIGGSRLMVKPKQANSMPVHLKRRRGRPSNLSRVLGNMINQNPPTPRNKLNVKINFTTAEKDARYDYYDSMED